MAAPEATWETSRPTAARLDQLALEVGCGSSLSRLDEHGLTFLVMRRGAAPFSVGLGEGSALPLRPPIATAAMAWHSDATQHGWLSLAEEQDRPGIRLALKQARRTGALLFRMTDRTDEVLANLRHITTMLAERPTDAALRQRLLDELAKHVGYAYTETELATVAPLPVSYGSAPVFDADGVARYEVQIGPLNDGASKDQREHYLDRLRAAATDLTQQRRDPETVI